MIKVASVPPSLEEKLIPYKEYFTDRSFTSFCDMASALVVCDKSKNIQNLAESMAKDRDETKARSSYNWFFTNANWDEDEVAQKTVDQFLSASNIKRGHRILLIIDDTFNKKKGIKTDGVGTFYDHNNEVYIWGNNFVTSVVQFKGIFIPHKAKMYVKKGDLKYEYRSKYKIAYEDIIKPFRAPKGTKIVIVFDSWWSTNKFIKSCRDLGHHVVCSLKSNRVVGINKDMRFSVKDLANKIDPEYFKETKITVRGKKKNYLTFSKIVSLGKLEKVKLVISKTPDGKSIKYLISTQIEDTTEQILTTYGDRWNIETAHREANQKLGFKQYQLRGKKAIERFIQVAFSLWTALVLIELENSKQSNSSNNTLGEMIESVNTEFLVNLIIYILNEFNLPVPRGKLLDKFEDLGYKI